MAVGYNNLPLRTTETGNGQLEGKGESVYPESLQKKESFSVFLSISMLLYFLS